MIYLYEVNTDLKVFNAKYLLALGGERNYQVDHGDQEDYVIGDQPGRFEDSLFPN